MFCLREVLYQTTCCMDCSQCLSTFATEALADFFLIVAADADLVEGLKRKGPRAWCIRDSDPDTLAQALTFISTSRALPVKTIRAVQDAFALPEASSPNVALLDFIVVVTIVQYIS